uniref:Neural EGFL like 1 n=1 Tax=Electrophorus electricus TaxID=8005 RepID=A0AAY5E9X8_ELEEL
LERSCGTPISGAWNAPSVVGFGIDPELQIDFINELDLANATYGISQIAGLHNSSKAFLFRDTQRAVHAPSQITDKVLELFRTKNEFTFMASIQQKASTSGVLFSIHESEHSYFELESSGLREEIHYHYRHKGMQRSETFPYRLADGQWHKIALSVSASHLLLHVDCNRIYERVIDSPQMDLTAGSGIWLGQHSHRHGLFKGIMQDVRFVFAPNGYILQCPNLNRTCPTCSDFLSLVQGIMDLQELLAKMTLKLNYAESRLSQLEGCHCERTCSVNDVVYRDKELWTEPENCRTCACMVRRNIHPFPNSFPSLEKYISINLPVHIDGTCCKMCRRKCKITTTTLPTTQAPRVATTTAQFLPLAVSSQGRYSSTAFSVRGYDFCAEGVLCGENSVCQNRNSKAECECKSGYASIHGDSTYCEDIDECSTQMHYCQANTVCVNLLGGHRCDCLPGFTRVDDFSCTEHDECASGQSSCDENAICTNTIRGHLCTCKPGYVGNGTICRAFCEEGCRSGGTCVSPNTCVCPSGFTGRLCETDVDECAKQTHTCWNDSACVNLPGSFDCVCITGPECSGDCVQGGGLKHNGEEWGGFLCLCVCTCVYACGCVRRVCTCDNPAVDLSCCPECDARESSQCLHQSGHTLYQSGDAWIYNCQQCRCLEGEVECWRLACPVLPCEYTAVLDGECCPRCVTDPCLADNVPYDIRQTCHDPTGITRLSGAVWNVPTSPCTICKCKNGSICCSVELDCLQNI